MHFAAFSTVGESVSDPGKYYRNNVAGTLSLLEAMRDHDVAGWSFPAPARSMARPTWSRFPKTRRKAPINPYGQSKLTAERMIADFAARARAAARPSCATSTPPAAIPTARLASATSPKRTSFRWRLQAVTGAAPPLTVFGDDYATPDGTCIRDYIHVTDLADAHVLALDQILSGQVALTLNLGIGHGYSVSEVIAAIERVTGRAVPQVAGPRRAGDPPALVAEADAAFERLQWRPRHSDLDTIVQTAWAWHQRHG